MKLGISTIYFSRDILKRNIGWQDIKNKLNQLGLKSLELNADIPIEWMSQIIKDKDNNQITILSLHNFCPAVEKIPNGKFGFNAYSLNSEDEEERSMAIKYTLRTIDYAEKLNAPVILHLGDISTQPSGYEIYKFTLQFGINSKIYPTYKNELLLSREKNKYKYLQLLYNSMDKIVKYAEQKKVNLAMETRLFPNEIPNFEEIGEIISHYKSKYLFYWHDFGHVEIQKQMGFTEDHSKYFETYREYLLGFHIHGVKNLIDHYSPHKNDIDYSKLLNHDDTKRYILEIHNKEDFSILKEGVNFIKNILINGKNNERISQRSYNK